MNVDNRASDSADAESELSWLRDFFRNAPDMFASVDAETGNIKECNDTLLLNLGRERDAVVGAHISSVYHSESQTEVQRVFNMFRTEGEAESETLTLLKADGSGIPVSLRVSAVRDADGRVRESRSILRDRRLQDRLQEAQRMESLALMAGGIAHDFNNLLVGILGNAGLALMHLSDDSPVRAIIKDIEATARRAAEFTNQMLAYSGRGRFQVSVLNLSSVLEEMTSLMQATLPGKAPLHVQPGGDGAIVKGDATQVRQVVMNLVSNAAEAIAGSPGQVTIRSGIQELRGEDLGCMVGGEDLKPGYYAYIEVEDNGVGMPKEVLARMFDPFFSTKSNRRGLGLAATLGIVHGHAGAIHVDSKLGRGTRVKVFLPLHEGPATTEAVRRREDTGGGLILVVDDEKQVRSISKKILEKGGYEVRECDNGERAVEIFERERERLSAVLLDMTMPHMDGRETFERLRRCDPDVPVILTSGYSEQTAIDEFGDPELAFLQKPWESNELLTVVRRYAREPIQRRFD